MKKLLYLLIFFVCVSSCRKKESCTCLEGPDISADQYLYFYIDDCLYDVDVNRERSSSGFGSSSGPPPFSITVDGENAPDTLQEYEDWQYLEHELTIYGNDILPEAEGTSFTLIISLEKANLRQSFDLQSGHCPYYFRGSAYNDLNVDFAYISFSTVNKYCSNSTSGSVQISEYRYDSLGIFVQGTFDFILYNQDNPNESVRLNGGFKNQY